MRMMRLVSWSRTVSTVWFMEPVICPTETTAVCAWTLGRTSKCQVSTAWSQVLITTYDPQWGSTELHLTTWPSSDIPLILSGPSPNFNYKISNFILTSPDHLTIIWPLTDPYLNLTSITDLWGLMFDVIREIWSWAWQQFLKSWKLYKMRIVCI